MTFDQATSYLAFALSCGAVYKALVGPQMDIVRLQERLKSLAARVKRLDQIEDAEDEKDAE